jgi:hypothetical protein
MALYKPTRRTLLKSTALAAGATLAAPYVKTGHSAGRVTMGLWDHWVPGANDVLRRIAEEWGEANNVEVVIDFITSIGDQHIITAAAEARARTGHDVMVHPVWMPAVHKDILEPLDDIVAELESRYGPYNDQAAYLGRHDDVWRTIIAPTGSHTYPLESRIDLFREHAGIDLVELFPAGERDQARIDAEWTYDTMLEAAKQLHAAGYPVGHPIGQTSDSQDWLGPLFLAFGAQAMTADGDIVIDSDATRDALEYVRELAQYMPEDVYAWDDAANNRWLISGRGSSIFNPPSAWTVAKRDAPEVAEQVWHHDAPAGPQGRYRGSLPFHWGVWEFAENKSAAKDILLHLADKEQVSELLWASQGYDMPLQDSYYDHQVWVEESPPDGTLYNYPVRGNEELIVAGYPAPPQVGARIYNEAMFAVLTARVTQGGESLDDAIAWAEDELAGYMRG